MTGVEIVLEAVGSVPVCAAEVSDATGLSRRAATSRLCFLRDCGKIVVDHTERVRGLAVNYYVRAEHAVDVEGELNRASDEWLRKA